MGKPIVERLFELLTGKPWTSTRSMAAEFGPPLASRYPELLDYTDHELLTRDLREVVGEIEALRTASPATADAIERVKRVLEVTR
jgi:hypothetical protein